jgi:hypothetical protein
MRAPTEEQISCIEVAFGFRFPPSYLALIGGPPVTPLRLLPRARWIVSVDEIRQAHRARVPRRLIPFLVHPEPHHDDYYCFDRSTEGPELEVVAFAIHAIVARWVDLAAWLEWSRSRA